MKVKISEYTPYLLVGLLIVVIARHFYNPLQVVDMWSLMQESEDMSIPMPVMERIIGVLVPTMASMIEMYGYVAGIIEAANNSSFVIVFAVEFACFGYIVITYLLEKIHAYWHEGEGTFAMCVDMLCIENIVLYVFNLLCYVISIIFQSLSLSDMFYGVIIFIFALPTMWGFLLQVIYSAINMSISMVIPAAIAYLLMYVVGETLAYVIMIILILLFSQVVWRLCSGFIYDKLLRGFSHNHLSLSD